MRAISLMYHDVVRRGADDGSGFPGVDAALYKLDHERFSQHLAAISRAVRTAPSGILDPAPHDRKGPSVFITFDDGGVSAYTCIADMLERSGWKGHFFVTAGRVGQSGFVTKEQIRELRGRGHTIGSHSWSHPVRMARCSPAELASEWDRSVAVLSDVLGERVITASVPGGHYARRVAETAADVGLEFLFTSEPTMRCRRVGRCLVLGRYTIQSWTSPGTAAGLASGRFVPRARQFMLWNAKKLSKRLGGEYYLKAREAILRNDRPRPSGSL